MHAYFETNKFFRKNNRITLIRSWNGFTISIMNIWNVSLNVLIILPNVWHELFDNLRHCFSQDYVTAVRLFTKGNLLILSIVSMNSLIVLKSVGN